MTSELRDAPWGAPARSEPFALAPPLKADEERLHESAIHSAFISWFYPPANAQAFFSPATLRVASTKEVYNEDHEN